MDFGIGFLTNNIMLPILDFFYGIVPSYGLAIVALTLVIRFALYPLNAGSIRNMRRMKVAQPLMQKRVKEIQERYKDNPTKLQEEMSGVYKEFGNPLAGCFPVLLQMPILFALFATLRGSPFSDINYDVNVQVFPQEKIEQIQPQVFTTPPKAIYVSDGSHFPISAVMPGGNKLVVGEKTDVRLQTADGETIEALASQYNEDVDSFQPKWEITKGEDVVAVDAEGHITALAPGEATVRVQAPGLAANKGFLFIKALGRIGVTGEDGAIHWDILIMILGFGASLYLNQVLSGQGSTTSDNPQQAAVNKFTPIIFSGMFLFFPLPAGVLMYMLIANIFQTLQTFILSREPLPENLQKIVDAETVKTEDNRQTLPFEPGRSKKKKA
ncbi:MULTISPECIES: membrane protein insertase YidC [Cyanophyceae]|uniref:Membrane protein insertase YidC n=1 Tax=Leptolyngbya subtilissima DQ-A4 TaxID=2933933 RepID=A0ABV0JYT4_9CYAN|nr:membrane protein insertase YidC [Nodosilinea sp. FACHB-141]MBD2112327.1 membrane protein insertase YidC [Nodosilinea sp. FACHB-141]